MTVGMIWAQAANGVIGRDNALPWHLPEDMARFKAVTAGATMIMGRRTWDSLPARFRPLPGRRNLVLTRQPGWSAEGAEVFGSLTDALAAATGDVWVMGGGAVYAEAMAFADLVLVTELRESFEGDVTAPVVTLPLKDRTGWAESSTGLHYRFATYAR
ncbi:dihydrofolate reductase [Longispora sp. K20-0274]|uniref:dihydrofolate reductase n=1 Tax=Longispora sp. K20-0274 TaxID=3088255 RepID=UPI00399BD51B